MLTKILAVAAIAIALFTIIAGYTQRSALVLGEEKQASYAGPGGVHSYQANTTGESGCLSRIDPPTVTFAVVVRVPGSRTELAFYGTESTIDEWKPGWGSN